MKANNDAVADLIPVDVVINLTLAAGWYTAVHRSVPEPYMLSQKQEHKNIKTDRRTENVLTLF